MNPPQWNRILGVVLWVVSTALLVDQVSSEEPPSLNAAWRERMEKYFETKEFDYDQAVSWADSTIKKLLGAAQLEQARLDSLHVPMLRPAGVVTDSIKAVLLTQGLVNDVATCLFLKAGALELSGQKEAAREAYQAVLTFPHARYWNRPQDFFWSPAEAATGRLKLLEHP